MLIMDYPPTREEELPYYAKKATWNLLHAYMDANSKILIDECQGYGLQAISILKYQCANMLLAPE